MRTSAAIPVLDLGTPPRRLSPVLTLHVLFGRLHCAYGVFLSLPLPIIQEAVRDGAPVVALIMAVGPLAGTCMFVAGVRKGARALRLLRHGRQTRGTFVSACSTSESINDEPVQQLRFRFEDAAGRERFAVARTHLTAPLLDEHEEPLLFDPALHGDAMLLDDLPGQPRVVDRRVVLGDRSSVGTTLLTVFAGAGVVLGTLSRVVAALLGS